ncbi:Zinc finger, PMZ-type [Corchorus capsularis]|uniref:Protein FAR1-RELATED SEQUENCE n=1 Tax=Corchorus capsularis TaxID=210143 RepID=A0A1R3IVU4_COCAP|nr:Zinc finger, PMZ-type [Corchorus capsularis]
MNTTQRSESINSFFDSFVDSTTTLKQFVVRYEKALASRHEKERKEDFESRHKYRILRIGSKMEYHGALVYTKKVFTLFQDELVKSNQFIKEKISKNGSCYEYKVSSCFDSRDSFLVSMDLSSKVGTCKCNLFEFKGILCRHILAIFHLKNVVEIPSHFILKRWTKEANKGNVIFENTPSFEDDLEKSAAARCLHVCRLINQLSSFAEKSKEQYKVIVGDLDQIFKKVLTMEEDNISSEKPVDDLIHDAMESQQNQSNHIPLVNIGDPHISQTKGRKKSGHESQNNRFKSGLEIALANQTVKKRTCHSCGGYGHNKRTCKGKQNSTDIPT